MTTNSSLVLLKDRRPDSCFVDQIYDPDVDGSYSESLGRVIPNEGAIAVDRNDNYSIYTVSYVNPDTYKSTLVPARIIKTSDDDEIKIVSYGNDKFCLYYDDRIRPIQLLVDGKLVLFGSSLTEYRLIRVRADQSKEVISLYVESNEQYSGDRIPLTNVLPGSPVKMCTNCHTLHQLEDGETIILEVFDHVGALAVTLTLFVKRSVILNDLMSTTSVITEFDASANQMDGSDFYVYQRQPISQLVISPRLTYSDGSTEDLTIDNVSCFAYGLSDFIASFPGQKQKVTIKKFLGRNQVSPLATDDNNTRFVTTQKWITVKANESIDGIKVSIIPIWNPSTSKYTFKYIAYTDRRDRIFDVTTDTTILNSFDGGIFDAFQNHNIEVDLTSVFGVSATVSYRQNAVIKLKHYNQFERYILKDSATDDYAYGVESSDKRRPVIHYDAAIEQYFIPTSRFANMEAFIEAFYLMARPPYNPDIELAPVTPTHFTIRNVDTLSTIIATPIDIDEYNQAWNVLTVGNPNQYVGGSMIVEFLTKVGDDYQILFGVPVDVHNSSTGYNTQTNP